MKISESCSCGATVVFEDAARSYATQSSEASVHAERWRAAHSSCLDCRAELKRLREEVDAIPAPSHVLDQAEIKMLRVQLAEMTEQVGALKIAGKEAMLEIVREATVQIQAIGADKLAAEARAEVLRDALAYYANPDSWEQMARERWNSGSADGGRGALARAAFLAAEAAAKAGAK